MGYGLLIKSLAIRFSLGNSAACFSHHCLLSADSRPSLPCIIAPVLKPYIPTKVWSSSCLAEEVQDLVSISIHSFSRDEIFWHLYILSFCLSEYIIGWFFNDTPMAFNITLNIVLTVVISVINKNITSKQFFGLWMGNCPSPICADIVMNELQVTTSKFSFTLPFFKKYVNDISCFTLLLLHFYQFQYFGKFMTFIESFVLLYTHNTFNYFHAKTIIILRLFASHIFSKYQNSFFHKFFKI